MSTEYTLRAFSVGYFANAQYDALLFSLPPSGEVARSADRG